MLWGSFLYILRSYGGKVQSYFTGISWKTCNCSDVECYLQFFNSLIHLGVSNFVYCKACLSKSLCLFDDSAMIRQKNNKDYKDEAKFSVNWGAQIITTTHK